MPDYAALAAQARQQTAPVDYAALAEQARTAEPSAPTAPARTWTDTAVDAAPMVGGMIGGSMGGPLGAAIGGGAGTGYGALIQHAGELPGAVADVARNVVTNPRATLSGFAQGAGEGALAAAKNAGIQGAFEGAGALLGKGLSAGASRLYQSVAKPAKALRAEFPTVVQDALQSGVPLGSRGATKADALLTQAGNATTAAVQRAEAAGAKPVTMRPVLKSLQSVEQNVANQPLREVDLGTLRTIRNQTLKENPAPLSLTQAQQMKQAAQRVAGEGYKKIARGGDINSVPLDANMAIASGLKTAIERRVPDIGPLNAQTQKLIGVNRMVEAANERIANNAPIGMNDALSVILGAGGYGAFGAPGLGAGVAMKVLGTPAIASRLAIGAHRVAPMAAHFPNAARAALLARMLASQQSEQ